MSIFLERVDSVPLQGSENLTFEIQRWMITLVDTLNTMISTIEPLIINPSSISDTSQVAEINTSYITNNSALTSVTLPDSAPVDSVIEIIGQGAGGWELLPGAGQTIKLLGSSASTSVASADRYDAIAVRCVVANTTWVCTSYVSSGLIIT